MKKLTSIFLIILILLQTLSLASCNIGAGSSNDQNSPDIPSSTHKHIYADGVVIEPTCTELGYTLHSCTECDFSYKTNMKNRLGHQYTEWVETKSPTNTEHGMEERSCNRCSFVQSKETPPILPLSQGLLFELNTDGKGYTVTGIGTCTDEILVIPGVYQGLPVTAIGEKAFYNNRAIKTIVMPDSIKSIGDDAMMYCKSLTDIYLSKNLETIGSNVFHRCTSLVGISMYNSVKSMGSDVFYDCSSLESVQLSDSLTKIEMCSFLYCKSLKSITIPKNVTEIGSSAFRGCISLEEVTFHSAPKAIGSRAFERCSALTYVFIPEATTTIKKEAFKGCTNLTEVWFYANTKTVETGLFAECTSLKCINIMPSVTSIEENAFYGCSSLETIYYGQYNCEMGTIEEWNKITKEEGWDSGAGAYSVLCTNGDITPEGVIKACKHLGIDINSDVVNVWSIGSCTCTDIFIPEYVRVFEDKFPITEIKFYGLSNVNANSLTISDSVKHIGDYAFYNSSFTIINIGKSVETIEENAFGDCLYLTSINVDDQNPYFDSVDGVLYTEDKEVLIHYPFNRDAKSFYLPSTTTAITKSSFQNCTKLTRVDLSKQALTSIGEYAFYGCSFIKHLTFGHGLTTIGDFAFQNCTSIEDIYLYAPITTIGESAFLGCKNVKYLTLPDSITSIGEYAFSDCSMIEEIILPSSLNVISKGAFAHCHELKTITIPTSVIKIGYHALYEAYYCDITYLGTIDEWNNIEKIDDWDYHMYEYIIYCTDGEISVSHDGKITYNYK